MYRTVEEKQNFQRQQNQKPKAVKQALYLELVKNNSMKSLGKNKRNPIDEREKRPEELQ